MTGVKTPGTRALGTKEAAHTAKGGWQPHRWPRDFRDAGEIQSKAKDSGKGKDQSKDKNHAKSKEFKQKK